MATGKIIHQGNSVITVELLSDYAQSVVVKKPAKLHPSPQEIRSLENEYAMTRALNAVRGVRQVFEQQSMENQPTLILEYVEGETLRDSIARGGLDLRAKLDIAVRLARILGEIHQQDVIHLDFNSHNILIANAHPIVRLIDLGSAAHIDHSGQQKVRPDQVLGALSYISPEQTGRINRTLDERSDLYSLGIVLYELLTGKLPFDSKDPMELVHHHIARIPSSPSAVSSGIPRVLSAIILKLLSKNAEDRYQSAAGVRADLERCLQRLDPKNSIEAFPLGASDYASRLIFPQQLYGRDRELGALESAFENVCRERALFVFVGGYSGIGKTALIEEIQRPVSEKNGYFVEGKYDQLTTTPYSGITQALALFVSQILTQTEPQLDAWRSRILEAVGPNSSVLTDVVPSLKLIIGPQPAAPDLSGQEAQNRFNYVFQRFFGAITRCEHPICFFLDDLQWIDPASLGLLKNLFSSPDLAHLLVIGAYRDNEVDEDHPLITFGADLEKLGANLVRMVLPKLSEADSRALMSDALRRELGEVQEFSKLIYSQTDGNPFFTRQVLRSLEDQGVIALDTATGRWRWDTDALRDFDLVESVVDLLASKLDLLPINTQETLRVAACIGNQFDIAILSNITGSDDDTITEHVHEAVSAGLIWEREDRGFFVHDRVQEAAYALAPMEARDRTHLSVGRHLLQRSGTSENEQDLFQIVDQLNHGLHLIEDELERIKIARLNLQAARSAYQATAFETGLNYASAGLGLLGEHGWNQDYRLALALHEQSALLAHAAGDIPAMKEHSEQVLQFGRDPLDLGQVQRLHIEFLMSSNRIEEAIDFGLGALRILGQEFPPEPDMPFIAAKLSEVLGRFEREPPDYYAMPRLTDQDPELLAISEIILSVGAAAYLTRSPLAPLMWIRSLELALERGFLPEHTPLQITVLGLFAHALLGKVELAYEYSETAVALASRAAFQSSFYAPLHMHALHNHFWRKPLREALGLFDRALQGAHDYGNNQFVSYASIGWSAYALYASIDLAQVEERSLDLRAFLDAIHFVTQVRWVNIVVTAVQVFRGNSSALGASWQGTPFDDDRDLQALHQGEDQIGLLYVYSTKAWVATLFGDHDDIAEYSDLAMSYLTVQPTGLEKATLAFICGLRRARELRINPNSPEGEQAVQEQLELLERFAGLAPMNFAHKLALVQAEAHRARGEVVQAMQSYERANQGARENGYLNEAGLAHALAASFYQDLGLHQAALHNLDQAALAWQSWGADALVESLRHRFSDLIDALGSPWQSASNTDQELTTVTHPATPIQLDLESLTNASQILAAETDLDQLCTAMISLVMANSGAEKAVLLLKQDNEWFVQARRYLAIDERTALFHLPFDPTDGETALIPESVFNYCQRAKGLLVLGDAQLDRRFAEDRLIKEQNVRSIACLPALSQGKLRAMLYLENGQTADVFTVENIELLRHLSAQFAISVENALLYDSLEKTVRELEVSQERYQVAVAGSTAALWDWDMASNTVHYSDRFAEVLAFSAGQLSNSLDEFWGRLHPDDYLATLQALNQHLNDRIPYQVDYRLQTQSGDYRWFHARGQAIWDEAGAATRMSGSITDVTERKQVEEALEGSEQRFRSVLEQSPLAMELLTTDGRIRRVNEAWRHLWGLSPVDVPRALAEYNMLGDEQVRELGILPLVKRAFAGEPVVLPPIEYDSHRAASDVGLAEIKGRTRWIQCHLYPIKDADGALLEVVNAYMDITDLRRIEQKAREQRDALARVERTTTMGQLTGSIAHELNQPLTGILSSAQGAALLVQNGQIDQDELAEILTGIAADAKRAGDVIRNLRELYREQAGQSLPVDIDAVVKEAIELLHSEFVIRNITYTSDHQSATPMVSGNRVQLQQVLVNLIMNGSQAMAELAPADRSIHIASSFDGQEVTLWVDDNGPGIDPGRINHIFEPLATWKPGGTGMGLAISNSIVEAHGGRMFAENRSGGGARVGFVLPLTASGDLK